MEAERKMTQQGKSTEEIKTARKKASKHQQEAPNKRKKVKPDRSREKDEYR